MLVGLDLSRALYAWNAGNREGGDDGFVPAQILAEDEDAEVSPITGWGRQPDRPFEE